MSLEHAIQRASAGEEVPGPVLEAAFDEIMTGDADPVRVAALLTALRTKGETVPELVATARALRARAETAVLPDARAIDVCGTGGDQSGTFNISTVVCFVVAGAGVPVAKHGNRAATSKAGSFDVLEALGVTADIPVADAARLLAEVGIGTFFARRAHPAMRFLAPVRQALPIRTIMNCMGPLLNPVGATRQLIGVYDRALVEPLAEVLASLGGERALVVHGDDGLDEITTTTTTQAARLEGGRVETLQIDPEAHGIPRATPDALRGGDANENAAIARAILGGEAGAPADIVLLNAGAALWVADAAPDLDAGIALARTSIGSGAAREKLEALARASAGLGAS